MADNSRFRSGPSSAVGGCSEVLLLEGHLQNNAGGGFEPRDASGVRIRAGIGRDKIENKLSMCMVGDGVWLLWCLGFLVNAGV